MDGCIPARHEKPYHQANNKPNKQTVKRANALHYYILGAKNKFAEHNLSLKNILFII